MQGSRLFVGNLPWEATEQELTETFGAIGGVKSAKIITDRETGKPRGFGFVEMNTPAEAAAALSQLNGSMMGSRPINVSEAHERQGGGGRGGGGSGGGGRNGGGGGGGGRGVWDDGGAGGGGDRGDRGRGGRGRDEDDRRRRR